MHVRRLRGLGMTCLIAIAAALVPARLPAQQAPSDMPTQDEARLPPDFLKVPVTHLFPGAVPSVPNIQNPHEGDPQSAQRGKQYFTAMNCIGCHADNGGGGMGPSLSDSTYIYGSQPANIFLTIYQGRPNGMPAWGSVLPQSAIWDLVTYVSKLSNAPARDWGTTFSREPLSPSVQQVPAELESSADPWSHTEKFSSGQKP